MSDRPRVGARGPTGPGPQAPRPLHPAAAPPPTAPAPARARRSLPWVAACVGLALLLGAGAWWSQKQRGPEAAPSAAALPMREALPPPEPIATAQPTGASLEELLAGRSKDWRVARLALNPNILVVEFPDLTSQGQAMNRLAALLEKNKAPRDRVLTDEALARFIQQTGDTPETFYFGHDYPNEALARFFTLAVNQQVRLNEQELRLGNLLLFSNMLREDQDSLRPTPGPRQAVVSFTALQADDPRTPVDETVDAIRREAILRHELSHGEFFTNAAYREHSWRFWQSLSDEDRLLFRAFLTTQDYDPTNEELMVNEAQAFLMHTPDPRAFSARLFGVPEARLQAWRAKFREGMPPSIFSSIDRR